MRFLVDSSASTTEAYFCLALLFNAAGLPVLLASSFAWHCSWHRNFQLSTLVFHDILEFFTSWINEVNTTQFSSIVKPRFFDSALLLFFAFRRFRHIFPNLWPQSVWSGGRLLSGQSPSGPFFSIQYSEPCETCPRI